MTVRRRWSPIAFRVALILMVGPAQAQVQVSSPATPSSRASYEPADCPPPVVPGFSQLALGSEFVCQHW
jgi:hypothetical protein